MVVGQDDGGCIARKGLHGNFSGINRGLGQRASEELKCVD